MRKGTLALALLAVGLLPFVSSPARAARLGPPARFKSTPKMVPMTVVGLSRVRGTYVVILQDLKKTVRLPVFVGARQARAIAFKHARRKTPRPMTHDLLARVIAQLGAKLMRIEISDLRGGVFIGRMLLHDASGKPRIIDARPSDLLVLGTMNKLPIYVAPHVLKRAGVLRKTPPGSKPEPTKI